MDLGTIKFAIIFVRQCYTVNIQSARRNKLLLGKQRSVIVDFKITRSLPRTGRLF